MRPPPLLGRHHPRCRACCRRRSRSAAGDLPRRSSRLVSHRDGRRHGERPCRQRSRPARCGSRGVRGFRVAACGGWQRGLRRQHHCRADGVSRRGARQGAHCGWSRAFIRGRVGGTAERRSRRCLPHQPSGWPWHFPKAFIRGRVGQWNALHQPSGWPCGKRGAFIRGRVGSTLVRRSQRCSLHQPSGWPYRKRAAFIRGRVGRIFVRRSRKCALHQPSGRLGTWRWSRSAQHRRWQRSVTPWKCSWRMSWCCRGLPAGQCWWACDHRAHRRSWAPL